MKNIMYRSFGCLILFGFLLVACDSTTSWEPEFGLPIAKDTTELGNNHIKDTATFKVRVYIDKASAEGHLGSGEEQVRNKMDELFDDLNDYWNSVPGSEELEFYYQYQVEDMFIYEGSSQDSEFRDEVYNGPIDFDKYDTTVIFDGIKDHDNETSGAAHGGGAEGRSVVTFFAGDGEKKNFFEDGSYKTLAHEFGHYRGITDLYQYIIAAQDNPVNGEAFEVGESIMSSGEAWDEYSVAVLNRSGDVKRLNQMSNDFFGDMYPSKIVFKVTDDGKPEEDVKINFYGSRAGGSTHPRDIVPDVFDSWVTNSLGEVVLENTIQYYIPDPSKYDLPDSLPYGRWFGFLAEIENIDGEKKYVWLPEHEVQMAYFENNGIYNVEVEF